MYDRKKQFSPAEIMHDATPVDSDTLTRANSMLNHEHCSRWTAAWMQEVGRLSEGYQSMVNVSQPTDNITIIPAPHFRGKSRAAAFAKILLEYKKSQQEHNNEH